MHATDHRELPAPAGGDKNEATDDSWDILCVSHLDWQHVFHRPHHLMSHVATHGRVFYVEEPEFEPGVASGLRIQTTSEGVCRVIPVLPEGTKPPQRENLLAQLVSQLLAEKAIRRYVLW